MCECSLDLEDGYVEDPAEELEVHPLFAFSGLKCMFFNCSSVCLREGLELFLNSLRYSDDSACEVDIEIRRSMTPLASLFFKRPQALLPSPECS